MGATLITGTNHLGLVFNRPVAHPGSAVLSTFTCNAPAGVWQNKTNAPAGSGTSMDLTMVKTSTAAGFSTMDYSGSWVEDIYGNPLLPFTGFPLTVV